jgi:hypothetical protein
MGGVMHKEEATEKIKASVRVTREDVTRAKAFTLQSTESDVATLADQWLQAQNYTAPKDIFLESVEVVETVALIARSYSLRMALYQAVWELSNAGEVLMAGSPSLWKGSVTWRTSHGGGGLELDQINCSFPTRIQKPPLTSELALDVDIFLQGLDCTSLHEGIREAVEQSLRCFHRGLYLPAIAMLTAGAEATWHECGTAVATKLANQTLHAIMNDQYASLSKTVAALRKTLESPAGKPLLKAASLNAPLIADAELWTITLRDRRNALHWTKAKSFVAQHSDTAALLLGAPIHLGTLEALRKSC